jgi:hypothetical protein
MADYRVNVRFDRASQKYHATSDEVPGLDITDMNVERLFTKCVQAAPDLLQAAGRKSGGFNLQFEKAPD